MEKSNRKKRVRKAKVSFNPNREFILGAMDEYLKKGGRISKISPDNLSYQNMMTSKNKLFEADDYLAGNND